MRQSFLHERVALTCRQLEPLAIDDLDLPAAMAHQAAQRQRPQGLVDAIVLTAVAQRSLDTLDTSDDRAKVWSVVRKPFDLVDLMRTVSDCAAQDGHSEAAGNA